MTNPIVSHPKADQAFEIPIASILVGERHRHELGDIPKLAESIRALGLLQPIGVDADRRLIFGERRIRAFESLGRESIPARVLSVPSILQAEHAENELRKQFTVSERVAIGKALEREIGDRRRFNADGGPRADEAIVQNFAQSKIDGQKTRQVAAKHAGFGNAETYRQAKAVVEQGAPETVAAMDAGEIAISTAAALAEMAPQDQPEILERARKASGEGKISSRTIQEASKKAAPHVSHNSGENEWYTPPEFISAARAAMGSIDLDPASSALANKTVHADKFYTLATNGLEQEWRGNVWLNPPYGQPHISSFIGKLSQEWEAGRIHSAIILVNNATETSWFQMVADHCSAVCFPNRRIRFLDKTGTPANTPLQGQCFLYLGDSRESFRDEFSKFGMVFWRDAK